MPSAQVTQSAQVTEIPSAQVTARPVSQVPMSHANGGLLVSSTEVAVCLELQLKRFAYITTGFGTAVLLMWRSSQEKVSEPKCCSAAFSCVCDALSVGLQGIRIRGEYLTLTLERVGLKISATDIPTEYLGSSSKKSICQRIPQLRGLKSTPFWRLKRPSAYRLR